MFRLIIPATVENPPIITVWISDSVRSAKYGLIIIGASDYIIQEKFSELYYNIVIGTHTNVVIDYGIILSCTSISIGRCPKYFIYNIIVNI